MWFNKRNKVKTEREKPKRKTFCAQGEIEIGGAHVSVDDPFENRTHNENERGRRGGKNKRK